MQLIEHNTHIRLILRFFTQNTVTFPTLTPLIQMYLSNAFSTLISIEKVTYISIVLNTWLILTHLMRANGFKNVYAIDACRVTKGTNFLLIYLNCSFQAHKLDELRNCIHKRSEIDFGGVIAYNIVMIFVDKRLTRRDFIIILIQSAIAIISYVCFK